MNLQSEKIRPIKALTSMRKIGREYWFWACLGVTVISLSVAGVLGKEALQVWNQPQVVQVKGAIDKAGVPERDYIQAADIMRGLIARDDAGQPQLAVTSDASGLTITGATLASYEAFITLMWQLPGMIPTAAWSIDELCLGGGCSGGAVMAKVKAETISISLKRN